jgi:hypothetical protein
MNDDKPATGTPNLSGESSEPDKRLMQRLYLVRCGLVGAAAQTIVFAFDDSALAGASVG